MLSALALSAQRASAHRFMAAGFPSPIRSSRLGTGRIKIPLGGESQRPAKVHHSAAGLLVGGGGKESNLPATAMAAKPVLKTGGATGPLPPPSSQFL
jgi:hypothetical protein